MRHHYVFKSHKWDTLMYSSPINETPLCLPGPINETPLCLQVPPRVLQKSHLSMTPCWLCCCPVLYPFCWYTWRTKAVQCNSLSLLNAEFFRTRLEIIVTFLRQKRKKESGNSKRICCDFVYAHLTGRADHMGLMQTEFCEACATEIKVSCISVIRVSVMFPS